MIRGLKYIVLPLVIFLVLSCCPRGVICVSAEVSSESSMVADAKVALEEAFVLVLEAGNEGANVTELVVWLNEAADIVVQVEIAERNGDANAVSEVERAVAIASEVEAAAVVIKNKALIDNMNSLWMGYLIASVASVSFVLSLLLVWRRFKANYLRKIIESKPEVNEQ